MAKPGDVALKYMERFQCTGPDCPEDCCHGWRVDIDEETYKRLKMAMYRKKDERKLFSKSIVKKERLEGQKYDSYAIVLREDGTCPMQEETGLCRIHSNLGEAYLSNVCATYPRRFQRLGDNWELTAVVSCPEIARLMLVHDDGVDLVPYVKGMMPRKVVQRRVDPRDIRPYWRLLPEVRAFVLETLKDEAHPLDHRLFFMTWFANRTHTILAKDLMEGDVEAVRKEITVMRDPTVLAEIGRRFEGMEAPSALAFLLARELVRGGAKAGRRSSFSGLVTSVFDTYPGADDIAAMRQGGENLDETMTTEVWREYQSRKEAIRTRAPGRMDQYLRNFAFHSWVHRLHLEAPDVMVHTLRMLVQMAVLKFLLVGHAEVQSALSDDALDAEAFQEVLDAAATEVFYKTGRFIEHSPLIRNLEKGLEHRKMKSLAGAVYLIRF